MKSALSFSCVLFSMLFLKITGTINAQPGNTPALKFEYYTSVSGLPHGETQFLFKDSKGFLWIGTPDGLLRFDGYEIKYYRNNPEDSLTINRGWAVSMAEDSNSLLWVYTTIPAGLNCFNPATGKFKRYDTPALKKLLPSEWTGNMFVDKDNCLWISGSYGITYFNPKTESVKIFSHDEKDSTSISTNEVYNIRDAGNNNLYVAVAGGFDILNTTTGKFRHFILYHSNNIRFNHNYTNVFKDHKNNLWICTIQGLKMFNPLTENIIEYRCKSNDANSISSDSLYDICESPDGRLWVTTVGGDLNVYNPLENKFYHFFPQEKDKGASLDIYPHHIIYDHSGKIWIQENFSIIAINLLPEKFKIYLHDEKDKNSLCWNGIQYMYEDKYHNVLIGTLYGMCEFNPVTETFQLFQPHKAINNLLDDDRIDIIFQDKDDTYWIEKNQEQLIAYNPRTNTPHIYDYKANHHPDSLGIGTDYAVCQDREFIWFGGEYCICCYNTKTKIFKTYQLDPQNKNPLDNNVSNFINVHDGKIWLTSNGLYCYDYTTDKISRANFKIKDKNTWEWEHGDLVTSLVEGGSLVWIGTAQGLFVLDLSSGRSRKFTMADGLPSDIMYGINKHKDGNLWLGTMNGLCRFTPPKNLFNECEHAIIRIYNINDGLPANELAFNSNCQLHDGTILFTCQTNSGLIRFHPDSLKDNPFIPSVYILHFSIDNKEVIPSDTNPFLKLPVEFAKEIVLSYSENVFAFTFAALNFIHPENNHYAYMLEGFDKDWNYTDAKNRTAHYTNIPAREYIFKVKGSNNDGVWNNSPTTIKLIITPPYWETWWFRLLLAGVIAGAIYVLYRFRLQQILKVQNIRNKISGDLHDDIGSTLNSISIYSQVAKNKTTEEIPELDLIGESSRKVMDAMSDIVWTINPENDSFEKIIFRMRSLTHQLMKAKKIEYTFDADDSLNALKLPMQTRKNFYLIFKEALNNLVKYSNATRASIILKESKNQITLAIRDNGIGFDSENPPRGNGLQNIKRRAEEIGGTLLIESESEKGTIIELKIS